jgi:4-nitrophenyl phosphatase
MIDPAPAWVIDLDGVVWLADEPIPGAADAVKRLRAAGHRIVYVTNNSSVTVADQEAKLAAHGIDGAGLVVTSAQVVAGLVAPGEQVLCCGGPGLAEALAARGAVVVAGDGDGGAAEVHAVVVGLHRNFDYERLLVAASAVRRGARLLASNDDATFPTPAGLVPGAGAILAAVEAAGGKRAVVAGKPHPPMAEHLRERLGPVGTVVGDRVDTDGALARALGWRFALVLSGVTAAIEDGAEPVPDLVAPTLAALVEVELASTRESPPPPPASYHGAMAQNDILKRFLDAGIAFTAMTQARAEAIVRDLVSAGEVQAEQVQSIVTELVDRSRDNTERFREQVRNEVRDQVRALGLATQDDIERLERRLASAPAGKASDKKTPAKRRAATKSTTTKKKATKKATKAAKAAKATKGRSSAKKAPARKRASAAKKS